MLDLVPAEIDVVCNSSPDERRANCLAALDLGLPALVGREAHDGQVCIVGGGPSLAAMLPEIAMRVQNGAVVWALNGAGRFLHDNGITPDAIWIVDARAHNAQFVTPPIDGVRYYLASQVHPDVFAAVAGQDIILWHELSCGEWLPDGIPVIGGGSTVGLKALCAAYFVGYRTMHLYGMDSCYRDGEHHSYAQEINNRENRMELWVEGRKFVAAPWMIQQVEEFQELARDLASMDCTISVRGGGVLARMARAIMGDPRIANAAVYDLAHAPASWDFACWLVNAEMDRVRRGVAGPLRVAIKRGPCHGFRQDALPINTAGRQQMLDYVVRPLISRLDAVEDDSASEDGCHYSYLMRDICAAARGGEAVPRLKASPEALRWVGERLHILDAERPLVITLREATHWPHRNSNRDAWLAFAAARRSEGQAVVFVRDTEKADEPIIAAELRSDEDFITFPEAAKTLDLRLALYELAKCNFFTSNGPQILAVFGNTPFLIFRPLVDDFACGTPEWWADKVGVAVGEQFPWASPQQKIVWADDTVDNIEAAWAAWKQETN